MHHCLSILVVTDYTLLPCTYQYQIRLNKLSNQIINVNAIKFTCRCKVMYM